MGVRPLARKDAHPRSRGFCPILGHTSPAGSLALWPLAPAVMKPMPPASAHPAPNSQPQLKPLSSRLSLVTSQGLPSKETAAGGGAVPVPSSATCVASGWLCHQPHRHAGSWQVWGLMGRRELQQGPAAPAGKGFLTGLGLAGPLGCFGCSPILVLSP